MNSFVIDGPRLAHRLMDQPLRMLGRAHGNRSAVTYHLKRDCACAYPAPNMSTEPTFAEIASRQLSRRSVLVAAGTLAAAKTLPTAVGQRMAETRANLSAQT